MPTVTPVSAAGQKWPLTSRQRGAIIAVARLTECHWFSNCPVRQCAPWGARGQYH